MTIKSALVRPPNLAISIVARADELDDTGVRVDVEIADPGTLAEFTGLGTQNKTKRLLDLRK